MLAVCGIIRRKGRVLVCNRSSGMAFPGFWEPPTESLDENETLEDALERVLFERLSVNPERMRSIGATDFPCEIAKEGGALADGSRLWGYEVELRRNYFHIYGYDDFRWIKPQHLKRLRILKPHVILLTLGGLLP